MNNTSETTQIRKHDASPSAVLNRSPKHMFLRQLAARAMGLTGADIERIVREARLKARREKRSISLADLEAGVRLSRPPLSPEMLLLRAVHETGHVLVHHVLGIGPIMGVTVDSGDGAYGNLGFRTNRTDSLEAANDTITMFLAGRAAEIVVFGKAGAGAGGAADSDLARATSFAICVERTWGLGEDLPLLYRPAKDNTALLDQDRKMADRIHAKIEEAQARAASIITRHRGAMDALVAAVVKAQALEGTDVVRILENAGARPDIR